MTAICFYFQVHQPKRLKKYTFFDIGKNHFYEDEEQNRLIFEKVANKCYLPMTDLLLKLIKRYPGLFKCAFSLSGVFLEQCRRFSPKTLDNFVRLVDTGQIEILSETYYHSLSSLFSEEEFKKQVHEHRDLVRNEFGISPTAFRNTELIYSNQIAKMVEQMGYKVILAEGAEKVLGWRSPNYLYSSKNCSKLKLLLRNYPLTDDIAFRFSERSWSEYPIKAEKYAHWLHSLRQSADIINLFMDFETFGEHQWVDSGIFDFMEKLPEYIFLHPDYRFVTPSEAAEELVNKGELDVPYPLSWADAERDLTAWRGNNLQEDALKAIYDLQLAVYQTKDSDLLHAWRSLLTSDHFYYLCTKYAADGDVHKYFSPYNNPYDAYINYMNVVADFRSVIEQKLVTLKYKRKMKSSWWRKLFAFLKRLEHHSKLSRAS